MATIASEDLAHVNTISSWTGFKPGLWEKAINVRDFIQQNYKPYEGNGSFLAGATERTRKLWEGLKDPFVEERKKGVLDISQIPSSITAHAPGYIDRANEVILARHREHFIHVNRLCLCRPSDATGPTGN